MVHKFDLHRKPNQEKKTTKLEFLCPFRGEKYTNWCDEHHSHKLLFLIFPIIVDSDKKLYYLI